MRRNRARIMAAVAGVMFCVAAFTPLQSFTVSTGVVQPAMNDFMIVDRGA